jgi:hypothetical protein
LIKTQINIMKKTFLYLILCLISIISITLNAQTYSGGSGIEADPYRISSKTDMETLATLVNSNGFNNYSGKYFLLTQDITEAVTSVIGNSMNTSYNSVFSGIFDGGGHKMNVNINMSSIAGLYLGVFGNAKGATIKNLGVSGCISGSSNNGYVGGICGLAESTTITNCYNTGSISSSTTGGSYAGGICGYGLSSTISNCYNIGNISSTTSNPSTSYYSYAGGICGYGSFSIMNCIAANTTIIARKGSSYSIYTYRIGYRSSGTSGIQNCYALATMQINGTTRSSKDANKADGKDWNNEIMIGISPTSTCSHNRTSLLLNTNNPLKWQYSTNNGNSWTDIVCTSPIYTETNPSAGHYIYRAQNGDGTY